MTEVEGQVNLMSPFSPTARWELPASFICNHLNMSMAWLACTANPRLVEFVYRVSKAG